ncbi:ABC transporter permease [Mucisphaera sp.]|uniref:ABC transporter permease n=1 Tax=Mucisphaera sp. TaxID=2913024 RepID=UPI003D14B2BB
MIVYLIRRTLLMIPTLLGILLLVFGIMKAAPGDVADLLLSADGELTPGDTAARVAYLEERYGLNKPWYIQLGRWMHNVSPIGVYEQPEDAEYQEGGWGFALSPDEDGTPRGFGFKVPDLGQSFVKNRPVSELIAEALPITITLNLLALPGAYLLALAAGIYAARYRGKTFDLASGLGMLALWSIPVIWAGVLLQGFLANREYLAWFPTTGLNSLGSEDMPFFPRFAEEGFEPGYLLDWLWHLVLPVVCLSYASLAFLSKLSRGAVVESLSSDYIRTARAKGLPDNEVLWNHALANSLLPLITVAAFIIPGLLGGSIIVERIFGIPGMGKLMIESIEFKDQEVVMAVTLISGVLTLTAYLIADLLYAVVDPRVTFE